ncbi:hypothetical protein J6590_096895 [Homalodisca vitripennis]|nr:hypothetical protein J6590_096895 [Homalodisca vitripennis]
MESSACTNNETLSLDDILTLLEEENDEIPVGEDNDINIYIQPPTNANEDLTDEDSGEEDITTIHNLPGKQLIAPAEVSQTTIGLDSISDEPRSSRPTDIDCEIDEPPEKQTRLDPGPSQKMCTLVLEGKQTQKKKLKHL